MLDAILNRITLKTILLLAAALYLGAMTTDVSLNGDDALYILMSRDFARQGIIATIAASPIVNAINYILFPLLLVPFSALAPDNFLLLKVVPFASALAAIFLFAELLKGLVDDRLRKVIVILFAVNPWVVEYSGLILTEMPFTAVTLALFVCLKRYNAKDEPLSLLGALVCTAAAFFIRPLGLACIPALILLLVLKRKRRELIIILGLICLLCAPFAWQLVQVVKTSIVKTVLVRQYYAADGAGVSFGEWVYWAAYRLLAYIGAYIPDIFLRPLVLNVAPRLPGAGINPIFYLKFAAGVLLFWFIIRGAVRSDKEKMRLLYWYLFFYIAICLAAAVYVARYLVPIFPLLLIFFFKGLPRGGGIRRVPAAVISVVIVVLSVYDAAVQIAQARSHYSAPEVAAFVECDDWIKAHTAPEARILSRKPTYTELKALRKSVGYLFSDDQLRQYGYIIEQAVDYVLVSDAGMHTRTAKTLFDLMVARPEDFSLVYISARDSRHCVFRVLKNKFTR